MAPAGWIQCCCLSDHHKRGGTVMHQGPLKKSGAVAVLIAVACVVGCRLGEICPDQPIGSGGMLPSPIAVGVPNPKMSGQFVLWLVDPNKGEIVKKMEGPLDLAS